MKLIKILSCVVGLTLSVTAQGSVTSQLLNDSTQEKSGQADGWISIVSVPSGAEVFIDSVFVGRTPLKRHAIFRGQHRLRLIYPWTTAWNAVERVETVEISSDAHLEKAFELGTVLSFNTLPSGVQVTHQGSILGTTPMYYHTQSLLKGELKLSKPGFHPITVPLASDSIALTPIRLRPIQNLDVPDLPEVLASSSMSGRENNWVATAAGSAMLVSGVLAAYLKDQANGNFDSYVRTKDPGLLARTNRLDRQSAAALIVSEVSFAILTYLLLFD